MRRLLLIDNAAAGSADEPALETAREVLAGQADVVRVAVESPKQMVATLAEHRDRDPVAFGGDGTLHGLVAALVKRGELADRTVGLIPAGTGNDFARALGLPADPVQAAQVVLDGAVRPMDLLVDGTGQIAVNAVHLGVGAEASAAAVPLKPFLHRLAYLAGGLIAGFRSTGRRLRVVVDDRTVADGRRKVLMVGIGNGSTIGGGTPLAPHADPGGTRADVMVSFAVRPVRRLAYGLLLRRGEHARHADVVTLRGRRITVSGEAVAVNADGEAVGVLRHCTWRVLPGSWRITVPAL